MRKLATIRKIDALTPIVDADSIECATVGGWKVVTQKNLYKVGDLAVYLEIDSWVPTELAAFLSKGKEPREFEGIRGERLRTIKLRGQLSQGLLLNLDQVIPETNSFVEGDDVTEHLGIKKWERPINAQLAGLAKGNFPSLIPKTDQERAQNLVKEIIGANETDMKFEVTEKLEGSSMTCYLIDGEFGVCSRNLDLKETAGNSFWDIARASDIEEKMRSISEDAGNWNFAIQGELIGPGIQGNIYKLSRIEFLVFDVYDILAGEYLFPHNRRHLIDRMNLKHVPVLAASAELYDTLGITDIPQLLHFAEGKSDLVVQACEREGVVFKEVNGGMTFKCVSNRYLLKGGE